MNEMFKLIDKCQKELDSRARKLPPNGAAYGLLSAELGEKYGHEVFHYAVVGRLFAFYSLLSEADTK